MQSTANDVVSDSEHRWRRALGAAVRDPDELVTRLSLPDHLREPARRAAQRFPLLVPESYLARMRPGDPQDPLLLQVLPVEPEMQQVSGFTPDPVCDLCARETPGLLRKYHGRALLLTTGACAVHCRYCFRRMYPYGEEPKRFDDWQPAFEALQADPSVHEVVLSGGDPLMLNDTRLSQLVERLELIPHLSRLRLHSRLPIVLPERVTQTLLDLLTATRLTVVFVVHANHPNELVTDCAEALRTIARSGFAVLNQAVLLRHINDAAATLERLCERLVDLGVIPYYLHQLDRVSGAAHFEVSEQVGRSLIRELRHRLPGYAVPQYVREVPSAAHKCPLC